jgi:hypothetical protein
MTQLNRIGRSIPYANIFDTLRWATILETYPLSPIKEKLIKGMKDSEMFGVLSDHLMKVARKVNIPTPFIDRLHEIRILHRNTGIMKAELIYYTKLLLLSVSESIGKNTSLLTKLRNRK